MCVSFVLSAVLLGLQYREVSLSLRPTGAAAEERGRVLFLTNERGTQARCCNIKRSEAYHGASLAERKRQGKARQPRSVLLTNRFFMTGKISPWTRTPVRRTVLLVLGDASVDVDRSEQSNTRCSVLFSSPTFFGTLSLFSFYHLFS